MHAESSYDARSPSSSPSLAPIDSSPPSSPSLTAICTPPGSPGPKHPFAASTKSNRKPRIYERSSQKSFETFGASDLDDDAVVVLTRPDGSKLVDVTPTRPARALDPFSASAKQEWRPPMYEKKRKRVNVDEDLSSASQSSYTYGPRAPSQYVSAPILRADPEDIGYLDDIDLTEDESSERRTRERSKSRAEMEHDKWDEAITGVIERHKCVIDLRCVTFFHRGGQSSLEVLEISR
ncbi:hypothetical protein C8Q80DRAFT_1197769 [Daedaleopsis nitida]|nr:hypothetical protein C8Q80DRAFT_1197769 [Daedaleopsis nitida]